MGAAELGECAAARAHCGKRHCAGDNGSFVPYRLTIFPSPKNRGCSEHMPSCPSSAIAALCRAGKMDELISCGIPMSPKLQLFNANEDRHPADSQCGRT